MGLVGKAPFHIHLHPEHHFFDFRIAMTAVGDPGENHRVIHFRVGRFDVGCLVPDFRAADRHCDKTNLAGCMKLDRFKTSRNDRDQLLIVGVGKDAINRGFALTVEMEPDAAFAMLLTGETHRRAHIGTPAGEGTEFNRHISRPC